MAARVSSTAVPGELRRVLRRHERNLPWWPSTDPIVILLDVARLAEDASWGAAEPTGPTSTTSLVEMWPARRDTTALPSLAPAGQGNPSGAWRPQSTLINGPDRRASVSNGMSVESSYISASTLGRSPWVRVPRVEERPGGGYVPSC